MVHELIILKTGTSSLGDLRGDFDEWIVAGMGTPARTVDVVAGEELPPAEELGGVVITGSASMLDEGNPWSDRSEEWLRRVVAARRPVLGICYGHQLLAHALGGLVGPNPSGQQIGPREVVHRGDDELLGAVPLRFDGFAWHRDVVLVPPKGAEVLATTALDPNHAIRFAEQVWGVQFHPEWTPDTMRAYIEHRRDEVTDAGLDPAAELASIGPEDHGTALLRRFASLA